MKRQSTQQNNANKSCISGTCIFPMYDPASITTTLHRIEITYESSQKYSMLCYVRFFRPLYSCLWDYLFRELI